MTADPAPAPGPRSAERSALVAGLTSGLRSGLSSGLSSGLRSGLSSGLRSAVRKLPPPRDAAAVRLARAARDLVTGAVRDDARPAPRPPSRTAAEPGSTVVRPATGLPPVVPLEPDGPWRRPAGITGSGTVVRTLYDTGARPRAYDVDLLEELNAEYAGRPIVPSPPSYAPDALAEAARRRVGWVHGMVGLTGRRTLEIGCGNGFEVWSLAHNLGCEAHGVDVAEYAPWSQLAGPRVRFECADLADRASIPYAPASFDRILSFTVWEHVTHPFALLRAVHHLLKPGGLAWIRANLHAGAQASHRYRDISFPWPHLLFSDDVVRAWDVAHGRPPVGLTWVNRLSWLHYEYYADRLGLQIAHRGFTESAIDEPFYQRFEDVLGRYPRADLRRDYLLLVLRRPVNPFRP